MKISIIGFGKVGQAMYHIINNKEGTSVYDKYIDKFNDKSVLENSDIIIVCLPTANSHSGQQDVSVFKEFFSYIGEIQKVQSKRPLIVIKSTILYENIKPYLEDFDIVMNPEFLSHNSSFHDSANQKVVVLGGRIDLSAQIEIFYRQHTVIEASYEYVSTEEAIDFKYIRNIYGAYKVLFWNWVQEQTGNARKYADLYAKLPQGEMSQVSADGNPGYGGTCFIKDVAARHKSNPHELTGYMQGYNSRIRNNDS